MANNREKAANIYNSRKDIDDRYSLTKPGNKYNYKNLYNGIEDLLLSAFSDLSEVKFLEVGCGELFWPEVFMEIGCRSENCFGTDILHQRMVKGREKGRHTAAVTSSVLELPFKSDSFDLICQLTLMTSISEDADRDMAVEEMLRVLKPGGYILWYDFRYNNPKNPYTRAIGKNELHELFAPLPVQLKTITVFPPLARKMPAAGVPLLKFINLFSMLRTHYLALIGPKG
ncbi:MAG: class I SAM-dependent methyltransferase [candidate division Zixibacteria bacterium]